MRITPLMLALEGFGSFKRRQEFHFPRRPGLYFMTGRNEAEPRLDANGTGKSTLWKALTWLLYGRTAEGLKAGDVCNWDLPKGVAVEFDFLFGGDEGCVWTCRRTWGPNSWTLSHVADRVTDEAVVDLAKDPQNPVMAELRLSLDAWLCCVLMAQGGDMFLDMEKARQTALFSSVMDLDAWDERADHASKSASEQDRRCRDLERRLADARGRLDVLERHDQAGDARQWERERQESLAVLERRHGELLARRKALREGLDGAQAREEAARRGIPAAELRRGLADEYEAALREVRGAEDEQVAVGVRIRALEEHLAGLQKPDAACPVCARPFDATHWRKESERAARNLRTLRADDAQIGRRLEPLRNRRDVLDRKLREHEEALDEAVRRANGAAADAARARQDLLQCDRELDRLEEEYETTERRRNPFEGALARARTEVDGLRRDLRELSRELDDAERQRALRQFWVRGFREVRLREIAAALGELEAEVNSSVTELGLVGWELEFRVDRETKSGGVQRGFFVSVRSPGTDKPVPWEAWSGGEKQRLRVAGNMGLANLVRARTGCDLPLEVWDEPTQGLSPQGQRDLFEALAARARREGRVVFLVDHAAHPFGGFAGDCLVVKTPSGSRLRTSW